MCTLSKRSAQADSGGVIDDQTSRPKAMLTVEAARGRESDFMRMRVDNRESL